MKPFPKEKTSLAPRPWAVGMLAARTWYGDLDRSDAELPARRPLPAVVTTEIVRQAWAYSYGEQFDEEEFAEFADGFIDAMEGMRAAARTQVDEAAEDLDKFRRQADLLAKFADDAEHRRAALSRSERLSEIVDDLRRPEKRMTVAVACLAAARDALGRGDLEAVELELRRLACVVSSAVGEAS